MTTSYRPGPFSRLLAWLLASPGRGWWAVLLTVVVLLAWGNGVLWVSGQLAIGALDTDVTVLVAYAPYGLAALLLGLPVALQALETFWPATGWPEDERRVWIYQFTNTPARIELPALLLGSVGGLAALVATPSSIVATKPDSLDYYLAVAPLFIAGYAMAALAFVISTRWLWLVTRIHREAEAVDPFDRAPVYAFSRLTVTTGLVYVVAVYYTFTMNAAYQVGNVPSLAFMAVVLVAGLAAFVLPLWGIHGRIVREKEQLAREVERRIDSVAGVLYADIDSGSYEAAGTYSGLLATLGSLRERVAHLPTWPWPPNLFRGFVTALLLPIVIFILTRVISTYLS